MGDEIIKALESRLKVNIPIELLQPLQVGLCEEKLDILRAIPHKVPILVLPIENGRYAIIGGNHRSYVKYESGEAEINSRLYLPIQVDFETGLEREVTDRDRELDLNSYNQKIFRLPYLLDFIISRAKINNVSDLKKNIFERASQLYMADRALFDAYLAEKSIKL